MTRASADAQRLSAQQRGVHQHGVRGQRRHGHVPEHREADRVADPPVAGADPVGVQVHAPERRGAPGPQVREHTAHGQLQRAHRRLRVRAVRGPRPAPARQLHMWHAGVLGAGAAVRRETVQPRVHGRVGHRRGAVRDGQQPAAVQPAQKGGHVQETGD